MYQQFAIWNITPLRMGISEANNAGLASFRDTQRDKAPAQVPQQGMAIVADDLEPWICEWVLVHAVWPNE